MLVLNLSGIAWDKHIKNTTLGTIMEKYKKLALTLASLLLVSSLLTACNTVQGAGEDIQAGGHAIAKAANDSK